MAKQVYADVIRFDAAMQAEGVLTSGSVLNIPLYIKFITVFGGSSGGTVALHDKASGKVILPALELAADEEQTYPIESWWDGIYVTTLDSGLSVHVHVGTGAV